MLHSTVRGWVFVAVFCFFSGSAVLADGFSEPTQSSTVGFGDTIVFQADNANSWTANGETYVIDQSQTQFWLEDWEGDPVIENIRYDGDVGNTYTYWANDTSNPSEYPSTAGTYTLRLSVTGLNIMALPNTLNYAVNVIVDLIF